MNDLLIELVKLPGRLTSNQEINWKRPQFKC